MIQIWIYTAILLSVIGLDQFTKYWAILNLKGQENIVLWQGVFELEYRENTGAAFSIMQGESWFLIGFTIVGLAVLTVFLFRIQTEHPLAFRSIGMLIVAGGIGNLIDRVFRGFVVDFLYVSLIDFPVFNIADCSVVIGAFSLVGYVLFFYKEPAKK